MASRLASAAQPGYNLAMYAKLAAAARAAMPTRAQVARLPLASGIAEHGALWRLTRRSVPRGVAAGLFIGIFAMIPGVQMLGAALMCVPVRGNVPIAVLMTFVSIPPTTLLVFLPGAITLGNAMGWHANLDAVAGLIKSNAGASAWLAWATGEAAPALVAGLFVEALLFAAAGYAIAAAGWRSWVAHNRRAAITRRAARP